MKLAREIHDILTPAERKQSVALLGLMLVGMFLETFGIGLVIPAITLLTEQHLGVRYPRLQGILEWMGNPTHVQLVVGGMLALVSIYLVKSVFLAYLAWRQFSFAFNLQARLSERLFLIYLRQPYIFHLQRNSAQLIRNATVEVAQFTAGGISPALMIATEGMVLIGIAALLLFAEPIGAITVVIVLGVAAAVFHRATRARIAQWGIARQVHEGQRLQHLQQGLGGAKDVKLLGRETDFVEQYTIHNEETARVARLLATLKEFPRLWLELLAVSGLATLVLTMVFRNRDIGTIMPTLGLFAVAAFRLMPSLNRVLGAMQSIRFGLPAIATLHRDLSLPAPEAGVSTAAGAASFQDTIELCGVTYTYPSAPTAALANLSVSIGRGECVGFIGTSGAGKSTLVDVLLGLLTPSAGRVLVDGLDIQADMRGWQSQIGYVPQSIYLTDDTLRRNVAFGLPTDQIDDAAVARSVRASQLEEFVASLPDGLETMVGERGVRLSGGQRQRIGIARALYHDPSVLVLDEATSALDTATERGVMDAVRLLHGHKTVLIVAHRLSTVEQCDRLYRIERGTVSEAIVQYSDHQDPSVKRIKA